MAEVVVSIGHDERMGERVKTVCLEVPSALSACEDAPSLKHLLSLPISIHLSSVYLSEAVVCLSVCLLTSRSV